jgi:F-box protein 45
MDEESPKEEEEDAATTTPINHLPPVLLHHLFTFLPLENLLQASLVCTLWHHDVLNDENGPVWKNLCLFHLDKETLSSPTLSSCETFKSKLRAFYHAWNPSDCSRNIIIQGGFTLHRNPITQSSDGVRGKIGNYNYWLSVN